MTELIERPVDAAAEGGAPPRKSVRRTWANVSLAVAGLVAAGSCVGLLATPDRTLVGVFTMTLVLSLMALGTPIGIAMFGAGALGLYVMSGERGMDATAAGVIHGSVASWQMSVVPLFVLMSLAMWRGGLTKGAYVSARAWFGRMPGGLAIGTNFAGAGLAAGSGSTVGISYALGRIAIPEMLAAGYKAPLATGVVAAAGTLGQLIPPSIMLVIYAGIAQVAVGPQIIAAIVPGLVVAVAYATTIFVWALIHPESAGRGVEQPKVSMLDKARAVVPLLPVLLIVAVVIGGMFSGIFTVTESAAFGAFTAILLMWILGEERGVKARAGALKDIAMEGVLSVAGIFLLIIGVNLLSKVITLSGLAQDLTNFVTDMEMSRWTLLLSLILVYLVLGMFLDPMAMMLLTVPLLSAPLAVVGVDMTWFGIFLVILAEVAIITPPVGMLCYIVARLAKDPLVNLGQRITAVDVFKGALPFVGACLAVLLLLIAVPELVTWLPGQMKE